MGCFGNEMGLPELGLSEFMLRKLFGKSVRRKLRLCVKSEYGLLHRLPE